MLCEAFGWCLDPVDLEVVGSGVFLLGVGAYYAIGDLAYRWRTRRRKGR